MNSSLILVLIAVIFSPLLPALEAQPTGKTISYQLNERVEVNTLGSWDKATIIGGGTADHEGEFKVHDDGWASSYDRWLLPLHFRKTAASASAPATTPAALQAVAVAPAGASVPAGESNSVPRLGKYNINSYGATGNAPLFLGHIELLKGGKYRISRKSSGDYYGEGTCSFDAATKAVQWLSGPCKDNDWTGTFTVEREGKTHKIRLRSSTIATNSTD